MSPSLKVLDVSGCGAGPAGIEAASASLASCPSPCELHRLMVCGCEADDPSLAAFIRGCRNLKQGLHLDLSGNSVGAHAVSALANCSALQAVCLHDCKVGSLGCQALCTEAQSSETAFQSLKELDLSGNGLETADIVALLDVLRSTPAVLPVLEQLVVAANPGAMEPAVIEATEAVQSVRHGLDVVRRSADTGERDGKQEQQQEQEQIPPLEPLD